ncbi:MAG: hypothetical protein M1400_00055 [Patescibacteria group bacterium]|nr:hypothetical protein [Patescibacteria group bacterium]
MKNNPLEEFEPKAVKREKKRRLRMQMHGRSLLKNIKYAGEKLAKKR